MLAIMTIWKTIQAQFSNFKYYLKIYESSLNIYSFTTKIYYWLLYIAFAILCNFLTFIPSSINKMIITYYSTY